MKETTTQDASIAEESKNNIIFQKQDGEEVLRFTAEGDFIWRGKTVYNDKDLVDAFRDIVFHLKKE